VKEIVKKIKSDPNLIPDIENWIISQLTELNLDKNQINAVGMAVSEAVSNSIIHGNKSDPKKKVTIKITKNKNDIEISLKDEGEGFNPNNIPDPTLPENLMKESGRGIHIMRTVLDDVIYKFSSQGTELILKIHND